MHSLHYKNAYATLMIPGQLASFLSKYVLGIFFLRTYMCIIYYLMIKKGFETILILLARTFITVTILLPVWIKKIEKSHVESHEQDETTPIVRLLYKVFVDDECFAVAVIETYLYV